jgi:hypothetical protein
MQNLKHLIRLEVEKEIFSLLEGEPELRHITQKVKEESEK